MKFSRNTASGEMEAYTDEGVFVGHVVTMGDLIHEEHTAQDGGPGSGNFGHAGRPGKVGGSAPGSGKGSGSLYRHEKKGVGFFGTRRDWLNGLEGEEQHKAARFVAQKKREMSEAFKKKETIEKLWKDGHLTRSEADERLKEMGILDLGENSPVEKYILQKGGEKDIHELFSHAETARNWPENHEKLLNNNLSEEERKVWEYYSGKSKLEEARKIWQNLHAKALGIPYEEVEIPEKILYESGAREKPKTRYDWYKEKRDHSYASLEPHMSEVLGDPAWGKHWSSSDVGDFEGLNKKFLTAVKYGKLSPMKTAVATKAIDDMVRLHSLKYEEKDGFWREAEFHPDSEMVSRLSEDEQKRLLFIANSMCGNGFSPEDKFSKIEDISDADFYDIGLKYRKLSLRTKEEQDRVREYVLLADKLLSGETPSDTDPYKEEKERQKNEEEEKERQRIEQRDKEQEEFRNSPKAAQKKERIKRIKETTPEQIKKMSKEEIKNFFNDNILCKDVPNATFVTSPLIDDEFYNTAALAIRNVIEKFPFLAGEIGGFGDNDKSGTAGWSIYGGENKPGENSGQTEIVLNYNKFSDLQGLAHSRKVATDTRKWFVPVDDDLPPGYADICHEMGHALAGWLERYLYGKIDIVHKQGYWFEQSDTFISDKVSDKLKSGVMKALGIKTYNEVVEEVSVYGASSHKNKEPGQVKNNTNSSEFFAECFCELMCSSHPRRAAVEFGKQLEKFIKDNKIDETLTARTPATKPNVVVTYK